LLRDFSSGTAIARPCNETSTMAASGLLASGSYALGVKDRGEPFKRRPTAAQASL